MISCYSAGTGLANVLRKVHGYSKSTRKRLRVQSLVPVVRAWERRWSARFWCISFFVSRISFHSPSHVYAYLFILNGDQYYPRGFEGLGVAQTVSYRRQCDVFPCLESNIARLVASAPVIVSHPLITFNLIDLLGLTRGQALLSPYPLCQADPAHQVQWVIDFQPLVCTLVAWVSFPWTVGGWRAVVTWIEHVECMGHSKPTLLHCHIELEGGKRHKKKERPNRSLLSHELPATTGCGKVLQLISGIDGRAWH